MKDNPKASIDYLFRIAHTHEDWISPLLVAVESVGHAEASWNPGNGVATVWEIVVHASGWLEDTLRSLTGSPGPENIDWPRIGDAGEASWRAAQQHLRSLVITMHDALKQESQEALFANFGDSEATRARLYMNMSVHDAYHAGQIVKLKQLYKAASNAHSLTHAELASVRGESLAQ